MAYNVLSGEIVTVLGGLDFGFILWGISTCSRFRASTHVMLQLELNYYIILSNSMIKFVLLYKTIQSR